MMEKSYSSFCKKINFGLAAAFYPRSPLIDNTKFWVQISYDSK